MGSLLFAKNVEAGLIKPTNNQLKKKQLNTRFFFVYAFVGFILTF